MSRFFHKKKTVQVVDTYQVQPRLIVEKNLSIKPFPWCLGHIFPALMTNFPTALFGAGSSFYTRPYLLAVTTPTSFWKHIWKNTSWYLNKYTFWVGVQEFSRDYLVFFKIMSVPSNQSPVLGRLKIATPRVQNDPSLFPPRNFGRMGVGSKTKLKSEFHIHWSFISAGAAMVAWARFCRNAILCFIFICMRLYADRHRNKQQKLSLPLARRREYPWYCENPAKCGLRQKIVILPKCINYDSEGKNFVRLVIPSHLTR